MYNAQRINGYLHRHWAAFAQQPYFDEQGVFISALMSGPLLAIMLVQLVSAPHSTGFDVAMLSMTQLDHPITRQCTRPATTG